ncbi:MAG: 3-hydroxyacyl-CoA dehydrogenase NAD-binding domain-containing protein [Gammaproteobacteria bacterium]
MSKINPFERYMMPAHFGPLTQNEKSSGWYHDVTMMVVPYLTDREKLAALLPQPFSVPEQAVVTVVYACSKDVDWLAGRGYNLIAVTCSAKFNGENEQLEGQYSLVWWENLADAILSGRESTGIPKLFADIPDHSVEDGRYHTQVSHFGSRILDIAVDKLRQPTPEELLAMQQAQEGKDHPMGWRFLPGVGGFGAGFSEFTTFPSETVYTSALVGEGQIDWNRLTWEQNPTQSHIVNVLEELPVLGYLPAMVTTGKTNLFVPDHMPRVLDRKETLPSDSDDEAYAPIEEIKTVCFVGAGTMGCINSLVTALAGYQVELYDVSEESLKQVPQRYKELSAFLVGANFCKPSQLTEAFNRISVGADLEKATRNADLVNESVFENLDLKRDLHRRLDEICPEKSILTTNTSSLLVSEIEDVVQRGDRFAAFHAYMGSRLIDIVAGSRTSPDVVDLLVRYAESLKLTPIVLKNEHPGYVMNFLLQSVLVTSILLVVGGAATKEEVDRSYMSRLNAPMGPFGVMDMIGLDLIYSQMIQPNGDDDHRNRQALMAEYFRNFVESGDLGMKSGKGFYSYPLPAYSKPDFLQAESDDSAIFYPIVTGLVRSAVMIALANVADPEDIDRTWQVATELEHGPFDLLEQVGREAFIEISREVHKQLPLLTAEESEQVEAYIKRIK